jgi:hypothetical protein
MVFRRPVPAYDDLKKETTMAKNKSALPINLLTISAAIIVVAFFLPWVKFGGTFSGYEIPGLASSVGKATSLKAWTGKFDINVYLVYALFLVPLGAAAVLVFSFMGKSAKQVAWVPAAMPVAGFVYGLIRAGMDIFSYIAIGGWLTIVAALVMLLSLLNVIRMPGSSRR